MGRNRGIDADSPEWSQLVADIKGRHADRMNMLLEELSDKEFRIIYPKLLEYVIPKLQRAEIIKSQNQYANVLQIQLVSSPEQIEEYKRINALALKEAEADTFDIEILPDSDSE